MGERGEWAKGERRYLPTSFPSHLHQTKKFLRYWLLPTSIEVLSLQQNLSQNANRSSNITTTELDFTMNHAQGKDRMTYASLKNHSIWPFFQEAIESMEQPLRPVHIYNNSSVSEDTVCFLNEVGIPLWVWGMDIVDVGEFLEKDDTTIFLKEQDPLPSGTFFHLVGRRNVSFIAIPSGKVDEIYLYTQELDYFCISLPVLIVTGIVERYAAKLYSDYKESENLKNLASSKKICKIIREALESFDPRIFLNDDNYIREHLEMLITTLEEA